ncbi:hypothetical protein D3C86_2223000 [compost metagenome]
MAVVGYLLGPARTIERIAAFAAAILLMLALPLTDEAGFVLALVLVGQHWWRTRRRPMAGAV